MVPPTRHGRPVSDTPCPHCTLKMYCPRHPLPRATNGKSAFLHNQKTASRDPEALNKLYQDLVQSKLERYADSSNMNGGSEAKELSFWSKHLENKKKAEDKYGRKARRKRREEESPSSTSSSISRSLHSDSSSSEVSKTQRKLQRKSKHMSKHTSLSSTRMENERESRSRKGREKRRKMKRDENCSTNSVVSQEVRSMSNAKYDTSCRRDRETEEFETSRFTPYQKSGKESCPATYREENRESYSKTEKPHSGLYSEDNEKRRLNTREDEESRSKSYRYRHGKLRSRSSRSEIEKSHSRLYRDGNEKRRLNSREDEESRSKSYRYRERKSRSRSSRGETEKSHSRLYRDDNEKKCAQSHTED